MPECPRPSAAALRGPSSSRTSLTRATNTPRVWARLPLRCCDSGKRMSALWFWRRAKARTCRDVIVALPMMTSLPRFSLQTYPPRIQPKRRSNVSEASARRYFYIVVRCRCEWLCLAGDKQAMQGWCLQACRRVLVVQMGSDLVRCMLAIPKNHTVSVHYTPLHGRFTLCFQTGLASTTTVSTTLPYFIVIVSRPHWTAPFVPPCTVVTFSCERPASISRLIER